MTDRPSYSSNSSRPDRANLKTVVAFVDPNLALSLKHMALDEGVTVQGLAALGIKIVHDGLKKRDKAILAAVREMAGERVAPGPKQTVATAKSA